MRILLLGANGQLGSDFLRRMASEDQVQTHALKREDLDVAETDRIAAKLLNSDFDVLLNTTGYHNTDEVESNAQIATEINAHAPLRLAEICAAKGARLVHISTDYVFGGQTDRSPLEEGAAPAPLNVYGATKLLGEALTLSSTADVVVARVSSLFGIAGASGKGGNFVETMLRLAKEKGRLSVVNDQIMVPTATTDASEALWRLIRARAPAGIYHIVNSGQASWFEFAREITDRAGMAQVPVEPVSTSQMPTRARRPPYSVLANHKLTRTIGWAMPDWRDALDRYLVAKGHKASR
jgi:dTDP-4-dehydrorhamnose reductase